MRYALFALVAALGLLAGAASTHHGDPAASASTMAAKPLARASEPIDSGALASRFAPDNPAIDMNGFLAISQEAAQHRESRRLTEAQFIRMAAEPNTIILDARSREMYSLMHVEGALNLPFPDIAIASLAELIPDRNTRILIYCNNNFQNEERAFASKMPPASLNLSTYVSLYTYGYRNVYELGPRKDVAESKLPLISGMPLLPSQ